MGAILKTFILKIGGHVLFDEDGNFRVNIVKDYIKVLTEIVASGIMVHVVVGGGINARRYIDVLKKFNASNAIMDYVGALVARLNALTFSYILGDIALHIVPNSFDELIRLLPLAYSSKRIIVCGGLQPGQSTIAVAALLAEVTKASFLAYATTVEGVYDKDPKMYPDARLLKEITYAELEEILKRQPQTPGKYKLFDKVSLSILKRSKIVSYVFNGLKPNLLMQIVKGENPGTIIRP